MKKILFPEKQAYVTIKEVEATTPCALGYIKALQALHALPDPEGLYQHLPREYKLKWRSKYTPTQHVPLSVVGAAGGGFLEHILTTVPRLFDVVEKLTQTCESAADAEERRLARKIGKLQDKIEEIRAQISELDDERDQVLFETGLTVAFNQFPPIPRRKK